VVNIAAVMAALDAELTGSTKNVLVAMCCRADRYTGVVRVSIGRVARDVGVGYKTAQRALDRLANLGYLSVDKSPGRSHLWTLTSVTMTEVPRSLLPTTSVMVTEGLGHSERGEGVFREKQGASPRRSPSTASGDACGKPAPRPVEFAPGSGYLEDFTGLAARRRMHLVDDDDGG
jgi:hypothetical protein